MLLAELAERLDHARRPEVDVIMRAIQGSHFVGIQGAAETGKTKLLRRAVAALSPPGSPAGAVAYISLDGVYSYRHLARRWLRAIARAAAGPVASSHISALDRSMWPATTTAADHRIREVLRDDYAVVMGDERPAGRGKGGSDALIDALNATERLLALSNVTVVIDQIEAPELSRAFDVSEALWALREFSQHAQEEGALRIVLGARTAATDLAAAEGAAFFGDGEWITVDVPTAETWSLVAMDDPPIGNGGRAAMSRVLAVTGGHVLSTLQLYARVLLGQPLDVAVRELVVERDSLAHRSLQYAAALHRLGPAVLEATAQNTSRYSALPDVAANQIAEVSRRLEVAGLVRREGRGQWAIVDPIVARALGAPSETAGNDDDGEVADSP